MARLSLLCLLVLLMLHYSFVDVVVIVVAGVTVVGDGVVVVAVAGVAAIAAGSPVVAATPAPCPSVHDTGAQVVFVDAAVDDFAAAAIALHYCNSLVY